jgi:hypothetical protein
MRHLELKTRNNSRTNLFRRWFIHRPLAVADEILVALRRITWIPGRIVALVCLRFRGDWFGLRSADRRPTRSTTNLSRRCGTLRRQPIQSVLNARLRIGRIWHGRRTDRHLPWRAGSAGSSDGDRTVLCSPRRLSKGSRKVRSFPRRSVPRLPKRYPGHPAWRREANALADRHIRCASNECAPPFHTTCQMAIGQRRWRAGHALSRRAVLFRCCEKCRIDLAL